MAKLISVIEGNKTNVRYTSDNGYAGMTDSESYIITIYNRDGYIVDKFLRMHHPTHAELIEVVEGYPEVVRKRKLFSSGDEYEEIYTDTRAER